MPKVPRTKRISPLPRRSAQHIREVQAYPGLRVEGIDGLFDVLDNPHNSLDLREATLGLLELYFNGLVNIENMFNDNERTHKRQLGKPCAWEKQELVLNDLVRAGKHVVGAFYRGREIDKDRVRKLLLLHKRAITFYAQGSSREYIGRSEPSYDSDVAGANITRIDYIHNFGMTLPGLVGSRAIDRVACVASGGFEPALLALDILGIDELSTFRYSRVTKYYDAEPRIPEEAPEDYLTSKLRNGRVLLVDDIVFRGDTARESLCNVIACDPHTIDFVALMGPPVKNPPPGCRDITLDFGPKDKRWILRQPHVRYERSWRRMDLPFHRQALSSRSTDFFRRHQSREPMRYVV